MIRDNYLYKSDQNLYRTQNCEFILRYLKARRCIYNWYKELDLEFPHESENNYRDSWYHYKKLYIEHSAYEVISQTANLKEHLQRAEKDALVKLFQEVCCGLETWMERAKYISPKIDDSSQYEAALVIYDDYSVNEQEMIWKLEQMAGIHDASKIIEDEKLDIFWSMCTYVFDKRIAGDAFYQECQLLLHRIKTMLLQIRIGGTEIARPDVPGQYLKNMEPIYKELIHFLNKYHFLEFYVIVTAYVDEVNAGTA